MLTTAVSAAESVNGNGKKTRRKRGEGSTETDGRLDPSVAKNKADGGVSGRETELTVASICSELRALQRVRVTFLRSRIMLDNRLVASVAVEGGYCSGLDEKERMAAFETARKRIKRIVGGEFYDETDSAVAPLIIEAMRSIAGFDKFVKLTEKKMVNLAKKIPVAAWVLSPEQRGFGLQSLAILVGECGDLAGYANPGKLWRRMGCAPFESDGKMRMGATWKSAKPGLSAAEWEEFGYSPRRRSVAFVFGENLVKLNFVGGEKTVETDDRVAPDDLNSESVGAGEVPPEPDHCRAGPYRLRYDTVKAAKLALESKDWPKLRCHRHAMLLAVKLLLRELWKEWNPGLVEEQIW